MPEDNITRLQDAGLFTGTDDAENNLASALDKLSEDEVNSLIHIKEKLHSGSNSLDAFQGGLGTY